MTTRAIKPLTPGMSVGHRCTIGEVDVNTFVMINSWYIQQMTEGATGIQLASAIEDDGLTLSLVFRKEEARAAFVGWIQSQTGMEEVTAAANTALARKAEATTH